MRFLIDASLPRAVKSLLGEYSIESVDVRDIGLGQASDSTIASYAKIGSYSILTADFDFADIRVFPPADYAGIVVVDRPDAALVGDVLELLRPLFSNTNVLSVLAGRLVIVSQNRIRIRPPL